MRTLTRCLTIAAAGGLLGPSLGEDLFDQPPAPAPAPAPAPTPAPETAPPEESAPEAPEASTAPVPFDPSRCRIGKPSQTVAARTLPGIRIWSAKRISMSPKTAVFEVQRWVARDTWLTEGFSVKKKERIGGSKQPRGQMQSIDFSTRWAFMDMTEEDVTVQKVRVLPVFGPNGAKVGVKDEPYTETTKCVLLHLAYLDANGNPAMGKDGKPIQTKVEAGGKNPVELPAIAEQDLLPAEPPPEAP